jgi:hypothetical protein
MSRMGVTYVALLSLFFSACGGNEPTPIDLQGNWRMILYLDTQTGQDSVEGVLRLSRMLPHSACAEAIENCELMVAGQSQIDFQSLLGRSLSDTVVAGATESGDLIFLLGDCCDQGELSARGTPQNDTVRGRWIETSLGPSRGGAFIAARMATQ